MLGEDSTIDIADFERVDMRVGRVLEAEPFPEARKPAYKLRIDFGPLGIRRSSAQLTVHYRPEELRGRLVIAVLNFPPRQIGPVRSEVLVLGVPDPEGAVVLLEPSLDVPLGGRVFCPRRGPLPISSATGTTPQPALADGLSSTAWWAACAPVAFACVRGSPSKRSPTWPAPCRTRWPSWTSPTAARNRESTSIRPRPRRLRCCAVSSTPSGLSSPSVTQPGPTLARVSATSSRHAAWAAVPIDGRRSSRPRPAPASIGYGRRWR